MNITWVLRPLSTPAILKYCSHCGCQSEYICSNRFRINAQQKKLDVWLIYKCGKCDNTWNVEIISRIKPEEMEAELYDGFMNNSLDLAYQYAFDAGTLHRNKADACHDKIQYTNEGDILTADMLKKEPVTLSIKSQYNTQLRLDKLLSEKTGITRTVLKEYFHSNAKQANGLALQPQKANIKLAGELTLQFEPELMRRLLGD